MMGYLRFLLAIIVTCYHLRGNPFGVEIGMSAVVVFYVLAGSVVAGLLEGPFSKLPLRNFFAERALRIYPMYFFILALTTVFVAWTQFGRPVFTPINIFANLTVVPLNYFIIPQFIVLTEKFFCLVPTAWSLALELQAYVVLALAFRSNPILRLFLGMASLFVFAAAGTRMIHTDYWSYRFLPGTFFMFLAGSYLVPCKLAPGFLPRAERYFPLLAWLLVVALVLRCYFTGKPEIITVAGGFLVGLPLVAVMMRLKRRLPLNHLFGALSYGLFLAHIPVFWFLEWLSPAHSESGARFVIVILLSTLLSLAGVLLIERPMWKVRNVLSRNPLSAGLKPKPAAC